MEVLWLGLYRNDKAAANAAYGRCLRGAYSRDAKGVERFADYRSIDNQLSASMSPYELQPFTPVRGSRCPYSWFWKSFEI